MPRHGADLDLLLDPARPGEKRADWIYRSVRASILDRRLKSGQRLPSTRTLAERLGVARGTVVAAFEQLWAEGYVVGGVGRGTFVSKALPDEGLAAPAGRRRAEVGLTTTPSILAQPLTASPFLPSPPPGPPRPFQANLPALDAFPCDLWARLASSCLRRSMAQHLADGDPLGYMPLREAVAGHLGTTRGVRCVPDQVAILTGTQQALDLVVRLLVAPGDPAWVEDPGYPPARNIMQAAGARVVPVPVDEEGLIVAAGRAVAATARLVHLTPSHQAPLGHAMSLRRRIELLAWAAETGAFLFEDDYDGEYRYSGRPLPSLQGMDAAGRVIYAGSFSKTLFPSLRLSYAVLPELLIEPFRNAVSLTARYPNVPNQLVLHRFIADGHFERHLRRMRGLYAERHECLLKAIGAHLGEVLEVVPGHAGLDIAAWLRRGTERETADAARAAGIEMRSLKGHFIRRAPRPGVVLGFAAFAPDDIRRAVERWARELDGARRR